MKERRIQKEAQTALNGRINVLNKNKGGEHQKRGTGRNVDPWVRELWTARSCHPSKLMLKP